MAKYSNSIEYNISTKLDSSGLTKLQTQIRQVEAAIQEMSNKKLISNSRLEEAKTQLNGLSASLNKSFNSSLGMLDLSKFRKELNESGVTANGLQRTFNLTGVQGQQAFTSLARQIGNFNNGIERTSSNMDKMFVTFQNTFRWGIIASFFSQFMNALHSSVDYVKDLDDSLTQIMLVTDYNRESMNEYAKAANEAAKAVGQTTVGMTNASLIFAQQGYDLTQSQELATLSAKLANASQQDTATTSDQITAYMNAYGLSSSIEDLSSALDSWALVANVSAADVAELATASQKAASTANSVGVNMDQLNAQIATIESVTRDAPEQIGNGLKTLYARFSDIKLGKTLEDGVNLGQVTGQLNKLGVQVLDQFGNIRNVGDILEDLMVIWDDLDQTTKEASAQTLAGKFQMNRFLALMDNSDMYREYLGASENAEGTLDQMNEEYLDSLEGRTAKIQASLEGIFSSIFDTDVIYPFIDAMQKFLDILQTLIDSLGGGSTIVLGLVSAFGQLFSTNIARSINDTISNQQLGQLRQSNIENVRGALSDTGLANTDLGRYIQFGADNAQYMDPKQYEIYVQGLYGYIDAVDNAALANERLEDTFKVLSVASGTLFGDNGLVFIDDNGLLNISMLEEELERLKASGVDFSKIDFSKAQESFKDLTQAMAQADQGLRNLNSEFGADFNQTLALNGLDQMNESLTDLYETGAISSQQFKE